MIHTAGVVSKPEIKFESGVDKLIGGVKSVFEIAQAVMILSKGTTATKTNSDSAYDKAFAQALKLLDGSWQGEARFIIALIGLEVS